MKEAPIPITEIDRMRALHSLNILDTSPEKIYERTTLIAKQAFNAPMAYICFVGTCRVWFKSAQGVDIPEIGRDISICGHAINQIITDDHASRLFEITDTKSDSRFIDNPLVINAPKVRYYMAMFYSLSKKKILVRSVLWMQASALQMKMIKTF